MEMGSLDRGTGTGRQPSTRLRDLTRGPSPGCIAGPISTNNLTCSGLACCSGQGEQVHRQARRGQQLVAPGNQSQFRFAFAGAEYDKHGRHGVSQRIGQAVSRREPTQQQRGKKVADLMGRRNDGASAAEAAPEAQEA